MAAPTQAPSPGLAPPPPPFAPPGAANATDILGETCKEGLEGVTCYKNQVTDNQIVTALWVSIIVGVVALMLFALLRSKIKTFHTRRLLGSVWIPPPDLPSGGIHHLWSWLIPLFQTTDAELIHTAGLDALILSWICSLGIQIFLPVTVLGAIMLLPLCLGGNRVNETLRASDPAAAASTFSKLTVSNIARGSSAYWVVFAFVYIVTAYICWLLVKYYQAYVILRQHYLLGGENLINEWHLQFLAQKEAEKEQGGGAATGALGMLRNIFDPSSQVAAIAEDLEDAASVYSGIPMSQRVTVTSALAHVQGRRSVKENASVASGMRSNRSMLTTAMRRRRLADRSPSPSGKRLAYISPTSPVSSSFVAPSFPSKSQGRLRKSADQMVRRESAEGSVESRGPTELPHPRPQEMVSSHRREGSELTREVLEAAGMAPSHDAGAARPAGEVLHEPGTVNPGGGGLRSHLRERPRGRTKKSSVDASAVEETHVKDRNAKSVRFMPSSFHRMKNSLSLKKSQDLGDGQELMDRSVERSVSLTDLGDFQPEIKEASMGKISEHETNPPQEEGRERIHRWWRPAEGADTTTRAGSIQAGKPNVSFRKIINTQSANGETIGVNAQCYAVLVMDVPDLRKERRKALKRAARQRLWWRVWYRFVAWFKVRVLLRKDVDRRTGEFIIPVVPAVGRRASQDGASQLDGKKQPGKAPQTESVELSSIKVEKEANGGTAPHSWRSTDDKAAEGSESRPDSAADAKPADEIKAGGEWEARARYATGSRKSLTTDLSVAPEETNSPRSVETVQVGEDDGSEDDGDEIDSELLVRETFKNLFPDSFDGVLPIRKHKAVDLLLVKWDKAWHKLMAAEQKFAKAGDGAERPRGRVRFCGCGGREVDLIDHWAGEIRRLEIEIVKTREEALNSTQRTSYFVFFTSQKDAAIAAQTNLHPEDGHSFRVREAPGPEEVNWQSLWMTWIERDIRGAISLLPLAILIIFPIGLFSGAINQATVAICNGNSFLNIFYSSWYCKKSSLARSLVTGVLPSVLLMLWQNLVMPSAVYRIAQQQGACPSLSMLDRRIGTIFFVWDVFNVFLGAMLGGSIFGQLGTLIKNPGSIASSLGTALPSASNFFINFIILQAFATQTVRMLVPHLGIIPEFFRLCGCCMPKSDLQKTEALSPHSIRYGREIGAILLIFIEAMSYAATSPIILPFALIYFCAAWVHWRYNILFISERCYESGGRAWDMTFQCMVWILFIFELFTGFVLLANSAFAPATVLWITMTPLLYKFNNYCETRYGMAVRHMPIETAAAAPPASVPAVVYMPPALRKGAAGWYPEFGKAWENFGMPSYTW